MSSSALTISAVLVIISMRHRDQLESDRQTLLRLSEERYRMLFEEAPDGILIINGINRIVMANSVIYEMTGYTSDELIGRSPLDFVAPEDLLDRPPRPFDEIKVPGPMRRERTLIHKNGSRLNVIISSSYMPDGELQYIIQDVSERKRMEEALKASEEKFAKSFQYIPIPRHTIARHRHYICNIHSGEDEYHHQKEDREQARFLADGRVITLRRLNKNLL